jgi:pyrroline-5-carboxylate reductase
MNGISAGIALIGYGNMGRALAAGWLAAGRPADSILIVDPQAAARALAAEAGLESIDSAGAISARDVVVLAVKPAQFDQVLAAIKPGAGRVYLSIAAGRTLADMARVLGAEAALVRAMPNTPAAIGQGMTGICASPNVQPAARELCTDLMAAVGQVAWLEDEALMDAVTAVSGSGPAYVFLLIECLTSAALAQGLDRRTASLLATATVAGAGRYAAQSREAASELRRQVTSPAGTTAAALEVLMNGDALRQLIESAVLAATRRSRELAGTAAGTDPK